LGLWIIPFFLCTMMTGWWVGFTAAGIVIRWGPKVQTVVWTLPGILLPFSAVYFPVLLLPTYLKPIAYLLPSTYIFESMRSVVTTGSADWGYIAMSTGLNLLYLFLAISWFVSSFRKSVKLGLGRFN
jgi:ABC-2 type transport system permease protein